MVCVLLQLIQGCCEEGETGGGVLSSLENRVFAADLGNAHVTRWQWEEYEFMGEAMDSRATGNRREAVRICRMIE